MPTIHMPITRMMLVCAVLLAGLFALRPMAANAVATDHPRLWLRAGDLSRLRSWATESNLIFREGLERLTAEAVAAMDNKLVPAKDGGGSAYEEYPTEMYAQLFAFMSLVDNNAKKREDYARRARTLLMYVIDKASPGVAESQPFRTPDFATSDRSRWYGSAFGLTVDWIYPILSAQDKAKIRTVFLRWIDENLHARTTDNNHPEPIGLLNDPQLLSDPVRVRWAINNYYTAHTRNIGLMALAFDPTDDPGGKLQGYAANAAGAWLYVTDHLLKTDGQGGFAPEGFEYGPQSLAYVAQFLLALHTAGRDDPKAWGAQVVFKNNPYWDASIPAYLNSLSPATVTLPDGGEVYQPAWYGDAQNYWTPDFIEQFGPMAIYDQDTHNNKRLNALRWIELNTPPGGARGLGERVHDQNFFYTAILYFLMFDPNASPPTDPRAAMPAMYYGTGLRRLLARTDWSPQARWFTYSLSWNAIDHQTANGNTIEFYRNGEWLTMQRIGYDLDYAASDNLNTLALENDKPARDADDYRVMMGARGSQWVYEPSGDPPPPLLSFNDPFVYVQGDATALYNSTYENLTDILHASRSVVWLKSDIIVVYDRATSKTANRFKRFWLNFPDSASVSGKVTTMTTVKGQHLFVTTVLPTDASIKVMPAIDEKSGSPANYAPMKFRLKIEPPDNPKDVRFLHVLQGADAGTSAIPVQLINGSKGTPVNGVVIDTTVILFPVTIDDTVSNIVYRVPSKVTRQIITGVQPNTSYRVDIQQAGDELQITLALGIGLKSDSGGVLVLSELATGQK